jgi:hypothetical protein
MGGGVQDKLRRRQVSLVGLNLHEGKSAAIIDRHVEVVIALPRRVVAGATKDPVAATGWDAAQFLGVQMEQFPGPLANVANRDRGRPVSIA